MRLVQYIGGIGSWGELNPETMNLKGLGGRETALLNLAQVWANEGHEVFNFVPTESHTSYQYGKGTLRFAPHKEIGTFVRLLEADALISWEEPRIFGVEDIAKNAKVKILEMQVAHLIGWEPELDENIDYYAVLSEWAGNFLSTQGAPKEKLVVFPNGVDLNRYPAEPSKHSPGDPWEFFYSSSPDRGLADLLTMWPQIREIAPESKLNICYGIDHWAQSQKWSHNMQAEAALTVLEGLDQPGVAFHGKVGQDRLAEIQYNSDILAYPCNTMQPTETGCITVVEAGASYSPSVITDCDCLGDEFRKYTVVDPLPLDYDSYIDKIKTVIGSEELYAHLQTSGRKLAESRDWGIIGNKWLEFIEGKIDEN